MSTVVNLKDGRGCDVFIGRPSKWGNPFVIGIDGTREEVICKHMTYVRARPDLIDAIKRGELHDKVLGCFCKPLACHGDNLVALDKEFNG